MAHTIVFYVCVDVVTCDVCPCVHVGKSSGTGETHVYLAVMRACMGRGCLCVPVCVCVYAGKSSGTGASITPEVLIPRLRALGQDKGVAGVVLRVDSPGGDALASDLMWREVKKLGKRVAPHTTEAHSTVT